MGTNRSSNPLIPPNLGEVTIIREHLFLSQLSFERRG
jgi:hypothetical protein